MKKKFIWLLCFLYICMSVSVTSFAAGSAPHLVDKADCLTDSEEKELREKLDEISARWDMDVVVLTVPNLGGRSAEAYADDFYDYNGYGEDGVLLLVAVESRNWAISTSGFGIKAVTDYGLEQIKNCIVPHLSRGYYKAAVINFAINCDNFIRMAKKGKPFDVPRKMNKIEVLRDSVMIGLVGAWILTRRMKKKLISVQAQSAAAGYVIQGSMNVTRRGKEIFLHSVVTHTSKSEKKSESSGGSTTHTSSSGETHGGSSGTF